MPDSKRIWVCTTGPYCCKKEPVPVLNALQQEVSTQNAADKIEVVECGCVGMCGYGPNALVMSGRTRYGYAGLKPADARAIIEAHKDDDKPVEHLRLRRKPVPPPS